MPYNNVSATYLLFEDNQFNGFRGTANGKATEIDTCVEERTATEAEVPVKDVGAICGSALRLPLVELSAREVEDFHQQIHV